jgi:hypothetical protein
MGEQVDRGRREDFRFIIDPISDSFWSSVLLMS